MYKKEMGVLSVLVVCAAITLLAGCDYTYDVPVHVRGLDVGQEAPLNYQAAYDVNPSALPGKPLAEAEVFMPRVEDHPAESLSPHITDQDGRTTRVFPTPYGPKGLCSFKVSKPGYRTVTGTFAPRPFRNPPGHKHLIIVVMEKKENRDKTTTKKDGPNGTNPD